MSFEIRDIDIEKTYALQDTLSYTRYSFKKKTGRKFIVNHHHRIICSVLDRVIKGELKKVIINIAPRYSKTEIAVKSFIEYGFALNAKCKFMHLSYSDSLVEDNSAEINNDMFSEWYRRLFEAKPETTRKKKWYTTQGGGFYGVSTSGQVTGFGAGHVDDPDKDEEKDYDEFIPAFHTAFSGAVIIDDPIKPDDALSVTIREKINLKFETTIRNRVNSRNTPIIIIAQRTHQNDLCGYLQRKEPGEWFILELPCLSYEDGNPVALWEHKHTVPELLKIKSANSFVFETQYQQNPKPLEGLMYDRGFKTYSGIPITEKQINKNYTDTADTGTDYLCSIDYVETEIGNYILDILYTQKPMEYTEPKTAEMITRDKINECVVESNNGGRSFARAVEKQSRIIGNSETRFIWFHQSENKFVRIFTNSAAVMNLTYFPEGWETRWPEFHAHLTSYMKTGKNDHDDAPDALTGTIEKRQKTFQAQDLSDLFH